MLKSKNYWKFLPSPKRSPMQKTVPTPQAANPSTVPLKRQFVNFLFLKLDPQFRNLPPNERLVAKQEFLKNVEPFQKRMIPPPAGEAMSAPSGRSAGGGMILLSYSLLGLRADCDLMLWRVSSDLESLQEMSSHMHQAGLGKFLFPAYSYLAMTRRSIYMDKLNPEHDEDRTRIIPGKYKYLFVYPFVKTRAWYQLPMETRQKMMDEHIRTGSKYPRVKLNTTYSYGLDDQEFVVAFETDFPQDFLDLVMELREAKASEYTLRDTPTFTCINKELPDLVETL
ncbi:MAG: chlorite dismutase family protein [Elusimicrobia bacterium]|nr:chlorite dismutase family protein [Elusimicrobiota bacterium]